MYTCKYIHILIYIYLYVYTNVFVNVYTYVPAYVFAHPYTHAEASAASEEWLYDQFNDDEHYDARPIVLDAYSALPHRRCVCMRVYVRV